MAGTQLVVLVVVPTVLLLLSLLHFAAMAWLAKRNGYRLKKVGWSHLSGYTAEVDFDEEAEPQSGNN